MAQKQTKGLDKNSNAYIIIYSTVMVVVVAAVLAIAALSLKSKQDANVLNEKKAAILASINIAGENVEELYDENIEGIVVNPNGEKIDGYTSEQVINMLGDLRNTMAEGNLPLFKSKDGRYIIPVIGKGLWGDIWGYVALNDDMNTISGVVFDHKGETPGLGAEIATTAFTDQFKNETIFEGDRLVSIAVIKDGAPEGDPHAVDAVSGGTMTSRGLENMLKDCLKLYEPFLKSKASVPMTEIVPAAEAAEVSNIENTEDNE